ncbi:MAG TPA: response regulator transcription factor [Terriglobales bacterium]|jgi:two-component system, NarL family, response regulator YdfI|nr:response regulator transcription factor [Terriglobales bacterium]
MRQNGGSVIRVVLAAASAVRRAGLEATIAKTTTLKLIGSFQSAQTMASHLADLQPDVVVLDLAGSELVSNDFDLERKYSGASIASLSAAGLPVVVLVDEPTSDWTAHALKSGVKAILPRDSGMDEILPAIQAAYAGLVLLDPEVTQNLVARVQPRNGLTAAPEDLTPREIEVLRMLAEGFGNREMASRLGISDHTVKFHVSSILDKLGAASRTEAVTLGIRMGLILL